MTKKIFPHDLLYQPIRQIAPDQRIAIESVLSECNNLLRKPIGMPIDMNTYDLQRLKNFHAAVDSVTGTHVRTGSLNCEACIIVYMAWILEGFMLQYEPVWYDRLKKDGSFSLLAVFEQVKEKLGQSVEPITSQVMIGDFYKAADFLRCLEQRLQQGNSATINTVAMAQAISQGGNVSIVNAPVFNNPAVDLSPLAEAQKYGFDMMRSVMEASRQPVATPSSAPEQPEYPAEEEEQKDDSSPGKRKAGRKLRSQTVLAKEQVIYDGWLRFSESDSGKLRDYAADNGMNEDEMAKLIDRNRPRASRNNSEK